ncbi:MAG: hypothetical protein AAGH15_20585 [Myxococcota bacterium]
MRSALAFIVVLLVACGAREPGGAGEDPNVRLGELREEQIFEVPRWGSAFEDAEVDAEAAAGLASVVPGATVDVFLGTWCSDSRREVSRLLRALGGRQDLPFTLRLIGVDRSKSEPATHLAGQGVRFVPTIIVRREGREVGRIVESAPRGVEVELLALLRGETQGVISGRDDV